MKAIKLRRFRIKKKQEVDLLYGTWQVVTKYEVQSRWMLFLWAYEHSTRDYYSAVEYLNALKQLHGNNH